MASVTPAGYTFGSPALSTSPLSCTDLEHLEAAVMLGEEDRHYLRMAGEVLAGQIDDVLDAWYAFIGSQSQLIQAFRGPDGKPDTRYLEAVRVRFGQWIRDTCERPYDQAWLDYQEEIGQRHYRTKKNRTDGVSAPPIVPLRYLIALIAPVALTMRGFLAKRGHAAEEVDRMHAAWIKAVVLHVTLWTRPYVAAEDY